MVYIYNTERTIENDKIKEIKENSTVTKITSKETKRNKEESKPIFKGYI